MQSIAELTKNFKPPKEVKTVPWQFEALEAIKKLADSPKFKSSIFKCYKENLGFAKIALNDSLELNKPFARYFLKVYCELKKGGENNGSQKNSTRNN